MIEDMGRVVKVSGKKAFVAVERGSACTDCGFRATEGLLAGGKPVIETLNIAGARTGDWVKVRVELAGKLKAMSWVYGIPVVFLIGGGIIGAWLEGKTGAPTDAMSPLFGVLGLAVGVLLIFLLRKRWAGEKYLDRKSVV